MLELQDGLWHHIVCVDEGAIGCGSDDPDILACQKFEFSILGNSNGPAANPVIVGSP
ncbi:MULTISPECIES: hypothetical protein [Bacillus cereus group]|uniref:hypothetical protein n=1 Tax=Bacillus cereus group TaxID=86661 RepID=UPI0015CF478E|nr:MULTISPECIES: hypothetical protein [Bacillus cereus group]